MTTIDLWASRDLPILQALVHRFEIDGATDVRISAMAEELGRPVEAAQRSVKMLDAHGYVVLPTNSPRLGDGAASHVLGVTPRALEAVGAWPNSDTGADRLLAALEQLATHGHDDDTRSKARGALQQIGGFSRDTLAAIAATVITGQLPGTN